MRRPNRSPRLAALCVQGVPTKSTRHNADRALVLVELARVLREHPDLHPIDAIVLPGGFFRLSRALGASTFFRRRELLGKERITGAITACLEQLDTLSPGLRLITGVLATPREPSEREEQVCLAFDKSGLVGAARKIFPTGQESRGRRYMSPYVDDYRSAKRFIALPNGSTALLNSCYDLFGTADIGGDAATRRQAIQRILYIDGSVKSEDVGFRALRDECLGDFARLAADQRPDVLLAAIHYFEMPGREGYWQRHGIARASARFDGALVIGAAHFEDALPVSGSTLAAHGVPRSHLSAGIERRGHSLAPIRSLFLQTPTGLRCVLRLFEPRPRSSRSGGGPKR